MLPMHLVELRCFQIPEIRFFPPSNHEQGDIANFNIFPILEAQLSAPERTELLVPSAASEASGGGG